MQLDNTQLAPTRSATHPSSPRRSPYTYILAGSGRDGRSCRGVPLKQAAGRPRVALAPATPTTRRDANGQPARTVVRGSAQGLAVDHCVVLIVVLTNHERVVVPQARSAEAAVAYSPVYHVMRAPCTTRPCARRRLLPNLHWQANDTLRSGPGVA